MKTSDTPTNTDPPKTKPSLTDLMPQRWNPFYIMLGVWLLVLLGQSWYENTQVATIPYSRFLQYRSNERVTDLVIGAERITGTILNPVEGETPRFTTVRVDSELAEGLAQDGLEFTGAVENTWLTGILSWILPTAILLAVWMCVIRRVGQAGGLGGGLMSVGSGRYNAAL